MKTFRSSLPIALISTTLAIAQEKPGLPREVDHGPLGAGIEQADNRRFELSPSVLYGDDFSQWTPALQFDLFYHFVDAGDWPSEAFDLSFAATGTVALDHELNHDPLRAHLDYYYMAMPGFDDVIGDWTKPLPAGGTRASNPFSFELGVSAAYETDQSFDHRNSVASAFVRFIQPRGNDWHGFLPSVIAAFDGVFPDQNKTAEELNTDDDARARLRVVADWEFRFSTLTDNEWLSPLSVHAAAEYSKEFGPPAGWEKAGKDESLGYYVELSYVLDTGVDPVGTAHESPLTLFLRASQGRIAPEPDNDSFLLMGTRLSF